MAIIGTNTTVPARTIQTIVTEALERAGFPDPNTDLLRRAEDEWLEEAKRDIASRNDWKILEDVAVVITQANVQAYAIPSPLLYTTALRFFDGAQKGTAQAGAAKSITLSATETVSQETAEGSKIFTTGGTGSGQVNRITAYNTGTKVATVRTTWTTTPDSTTTYMIADVELPLGPGHVGLRRAAGVGTGYVSHWEEFEGEVYLSPIPDLSTYALEMRGKVDISLVNETSNRFTQILREWHLALVLGVMVAALEDKDDDTGRIVEGRYERAILNLKREDHRMRTKTERPIARLMGGLPIRKF